MNFRQLFTFLVLLAGSQAIFAQGPHDRLVEITQSKANDIISALSVTDEIAARVSKVYINEAISIEDIIVNAEPDVAIINEIHFLEQVRINQMRNMLDDATFKLYQYILEEQEVQQDSRFDSLQIYLDNEDLKQNTLTYFDDNVVPYLIYYHQTFFKPALRQKHYWRINQSRQSLYKYEEMKRADKEGIIEAAKLDQALINLSNSIVSLKKIRKRYKDELDYISVALGPMERIWSDDFIAMCKEQFADDVYLRIKAYSHSMNAYGMDYLLGELSLVLFDVWNPRSYVESRETLVELFRENIK